MGIHGVDAGGLLLQSNQKALHAALARADRVVSF